MAFFNPVDPEGKVNTVNPLLSPPPPPLHSQISPLPLISTPFQVKQVNKLPSPPPYYSSLINDRQSNRENREHQNYFWNVIVMQEKSQPGVRKLNRKQER